MPLLEDNADGREMLLAMLTMEGHEIAEAADGPSGIEQILASRPDVAIVDIALPVVDGYEVARRISASARARSTVLVALTGHGQPEYRRRALEPTFNAHLVKPVTPEALQSIFAGAFPRAR